MFSTQPKSDIDYLEMATIEMSHGLDPVVSTITLDWDGDLEIRVSKKLLDYLMRMAAVIMNQTSQARNAIVLNFFTGLRHRTFSDLYHHFSMSFISSWRRLAS